jgi:cation diffusion facilitator family transporter
MEKGRSTYLAVGGGITVFILKILAFLLSGSIALLSDALESITNIIASFIMLLSVNVSVRPADTSHKYGHQKAENISCFVEGALVTVAALAILWAAIGRLITPVELGPLDIALGVSLLATGINAGLSWKLAKTARETNSLALEGDSKHLLSDVLSSFGVIAGLVVAKISGWSILDPALAFVVAGLVLKMGIGLIMKAGGGLMDQSCPEEEEKIQMVIERHKPQFIDFHELKTRRSGDRIFAELHLSVDPKITVAEAHTLTDHLEDDLKKELPEVTLVIHIEPPKSRGH